MKPALSALSPRGNKGKQFKARKERVIPGEVTNNASEMRSIDLYLSVAEPSALWSVGLPVLQLPPIVHRNFPPGLAVGIFLLPNKARSFSEVGS